MLPHYVIKDIVLLYNHVLRAVSRLCVGRFGAFCMVLCVRWQQIVKEEMPKYPCFSSAHCQRTDAHMTGVSYQVEDSEAQYVPNVMLIHE